MGGERRAGRAHWNARRRRRQGAGAGHVRAHPESCRPARRRPRKSGRTSERARGLWGPGPGRRGAAARAEAGPDRHQARRPGGGEGRRGAARPGRGTARAHDGGRAPGGRAGEAQRRAAAAVEAQALRAHRARAAALRGQGRRRPAQGAQLCPHQGRGVRGEYRPPHLLHAGDRGRRGDRLPLPAGGPGLERADHARPGQVQEPAGHPDRARPAEPRRRGAGVLERWGAPGLPEVGRVSFWAPFGSWGVTVLLTVLRVARLQLWTPLWRRRWSHGSAGTSEEGDGHGGAEDEDLAPGAQAIRTCPPWAQPLRSAKPSPAVALVSALQTVRLRLGAVPAGGRPPRGAEPVPQDSRGPPGAHEMNPPGSALDSPWWGELMGPRPTLGVVCSLGPFWEPHSSRPLFAHFFPPPAHLPRTAVPGLEVVGWVEAQPLPFHACP